MGYWSKRGEQEGEFIITPEMAMRAAQLGIKIYQQIESDPRLGPHARRLYREAGKKVERDTAERHARNGSPQPNPHERKFRSIINSKNGPTF